MQVAINPNIYEPAQLYAKRKGLSLSQMIEDYLSQLVASTKVQAPAKKHREIEITPGAAWFERGRSLDVTDEELDQMRYKHLMEKYK